MSYGLYSQNKLFSLLIGINPVGTSEGIYVRFLGVLRVSVRIVRTMGVASSIEREFYTANHLMHGSRSYMFVIYCI